MIITSTLHTVQAVCMAWEVATGTCYPQICGGGCTVLTWVIFFREHVDHNRRHTHSQKLYHVTSRCKQTRENTITLHTYTCILVYCCTFMFYNHVLQGFAGRCILLFELMVLFRTKRFFFLWRVNRWASNSQEKILIQKSQALHIFAWWYSASVGPHPYFWFPQNDLKISSTRISWKQLSTWYIVCVSLLWLCLWHHFHTCCALTTGKLYAECTVEHRSHRTKLCEKYVAKSRTKSFKQTNLLRFVWTSMLYSAEVLIYRLSSRFDDTSEYSITDFARYFTLSNSLRRVKQ